MRFGKALLALTSFAFGINVVVLGQKTSPISPEIDSILQTHKTFVFFPFSVKTTYKEVPPGLESGKMSADDYTAMFLFPRLAAANIQKGKDGPYAAEVGDFTLLAKRMYATLGDSGNLLLLAPDKIKELAQADAYFMGYIGKQDYRERSGKNKVSAQAMLGGSGGMASGAETTAADWKVTVILYDTKTRRQLWKYDEQISQSFSEKDESLAKSFARTFGKRIPYKWKKK
jgi:hypothetical protein